jgi:hypothetical protein
VQHAQHHLRHDVTRPEQRLPAAPDAQLARLLARQRQQGVCGQAGGSGAGRWMGAKAGG